MTPRKKDLPPDWRQQRWPKGQQVARRWPDRTLEERFMEKVSVDETTGCWVWTAALSNGYAWFNSDGEPRLGHRVAYEIFVGPIPADLTLDHICHTEDPACAGGDSCPHRRCVNPAHLEPVTLAENTARGRSPSALNARKTHCNRGHEYTAENTYISAQGYRQCRTCHRDYNRERYRLNRELILEQQKRAYARRRAA